MLKRASQLPECLLALHATFNLTIHLYTSARVVYYDKSRHKNHSKSQIQVPSILDPLPFTS